MLLAVFRTGGLRQIVTCDGRLVFTRQTQAPSCEARIDAVHESIARVIADNRNYLARFGLTDDQDLRVVYASEAFEDCDALFAASVAARRKLRLPLLPPAIKRKQEEARVARWGMRTALAVFALAFVVTAGNAAQLAIQLYKNYEASREVATFAND